MCEAEGDRIVYESVYRTFRERSIDVRFVPSEGTGGFADPIRLYKALEVPTAVIADIDFLAKDGELKKVLNELGVSSDAVAELCKRAREAVTHIRACITQMGPGAIQTALRELADTKIDPTTNDDVKVRGKMQDIANKMYRLHELKLRGLDAIPETHTVDSSTVSLQNDVRTLLKDLASHGLFLVPVGELESWLPILMKGQSREDKSKWAMLAAEKVEDVGERDEDIWKFICSVRGFLEQRLQSTVK
jgi:hypothetical protein